MNIICPKILSIALVSCLCLSGCGETLRGLKNDMSRIGESVGEAGRNVTTSLAQRRDGNEQSCPEVVVLPTHDRIYEFTDPDDPDMREMVSVFYLTDARNDCAAGEEENMLALTINLYFEGETGPKAKRRENDKPSFSYPYFISVRDRNDTELAREIFAVSPDYESEENSVRMVETIRQSLPINENLMPYRIEVGFELDDDQLFYNTSTPENSRFQGVDIAEAQGAAPAPSTEQQPAFIPANENTSTETE